MSKIAEQKAIEMFPDIKWTTERQIHHDGTDYDGRMGFELGYDQAMQDFLEKTEEFLYLQLNNGSIECGNIERLIDDFKKHIEEEL